ncbi:glycoside hydrolase family 32 protein [Flavobacterium sp.]|uniref:glycoside hydrolase family 32 protein n=1 Tax=Flavobacterium sp. TaxID=239 RepID=UPI0026176670|nr:glycoside hydrolase family 32 protein [Flavobacterium sp.]
MVKLKKMKVLPKTYLIPVFLCLLNIGCQKVKDNEFSIPTAVQLTSNPDQLFKEPYRPQFHFTPQKKWMNDPNGMVFYKGVYHLFYQYYPEDIVWGPMHWGHATSTDLLHWQHKKIALFPDELGLIFSGSAVIDYNNTSGLGTKEHLPMVAIFTYHNMVFEKAGKINTQSQGLAYSLDEGETWKKYERNPIISNADKKDFRDPKVFWNPETKLWTMALVAGDRAEFYTSKNLINWTKESEFGKEYGAHGGVWECPDIFKLKVNGNGEEKWILIISINPGAPNGGSGTQYFVGNFDGKTFTSTQKEPKWIDFGTDNYAGVTYNDAPNNQRIFIGWMSNWLYARNTPTKNWRSAMTLPRTLELTKINGEYLLKNKPIAAFKKLQKPAFTSKKIPLKANQKTDFKYEAFNQSEIRFKAANKDLQLVFSNDVKDSLVLHYNSQSKIFSIDRRKSGKVAFEKNFGKDIHKSNVSALIANQINFQIILDWSSIELFLNDGLYSFTEQIFPQKPYTQLSILSTEDQELQDFTISSISSIWPKKIAKNE